MKFIDLQAQRKLIHDQINNNICQVLEHNLFILGPEVQELETKLANIANTKHCITICSGTIALQVALMALGIQPGDEVITSAFSFFATAEVIMLLGATPIFVDIDPITYNIDPNLIEAAITPRTKAIIPVSLYGQCADMDAINTIASQYNLAVIEDGAQSFGAKYKGKPSCSLSTIGCTSFFPTKPLGCYGDGGACFTNDDELAKQLRLAMNHGQETRYHHICLGTNARFNTLQAAILLAKLDLFPQEIALRQQVAKWYEQYLPEEVAKPNIASYNESVYAQYTVRLSNRDKIKTALAKLGIPAMTHYPKPLHKQPIFAKLNPDLHLPHSEKAADEVLSLPFYPYMPESDVAKVSEAFKSIFCVA